MTKMDLIIAVKDVNASSAWYEAVFGCKRTHGGDEFAVMEDEDGEVLVCLHKWGAHEHPTMADQKITPGNGVILYFKTDNIGMVRERIEKMSYTLDEDTHINPNSTKLEFSLRDPDGYYIIVTEYHKYGG